MGKVAYHSPLIGEALGGKEVRAVAAKKDAVKIPELNARMLAALCEDFFAQPGMEEEYQQWLAAQKEARKKKTKEKAV